MLISSNRELLRELFIRSYFDRIQHLNTIAMKGFEARSINLK